MRRARGVAAAITFVGLAIGCVKAGDAANKTPSTIRRERILDIEQGGYRVAVANVDDGGASLRLTHFDGCAAVEIEERGGVVLSRSTTNFEPCDETPAGDDSFSIALNGRTSATGIHALQTDASGVVYVSKDDLSRLAIDEPSELVITVGGKTFTQGMPAGLAEVAQQGRQARLVEAERVEAELTAREVASGKCTPERTANLQEAVATLRLMFSEMGERSQFYAVGGHEIVVATERGTSFAFQSGLLPSTAHILALGFNSVNLTVADANGNEVSSRSGLAGAAQHFLRGAQVDSRAFPVSPLSRIKGSVRGRGCSLIVAVAAR